MTPNATQGCLAEWNCPIGQCYRTTNDDQKCVTSLNGRDFSSKWHTDINLSPGRPDHCSLTSRQPQTSATPIRLSACQPSSALTPSWSLHSSSTARNSHHSSSTVAPWSSHGSTRMVSTWVSQFRKQCLRLASFSTCRVWYGWLPSTRAIQMPACWRGWPHASHCAGQWWRRPPPGKLLWRRTTITPCPLHLRKRRKACPNKLRNTPTPATRGHTIRSVQSQFSCCWWLTAETIMNSMESFPCFVLIGVSFYFNYAKWIWFKSWKLQAMNGENNNIHLRYLTLRCFFIHHKSHKYVLSLIIHTPPIFYMCTRPPGNP